jgi:hypothetical protein
MLGLQVWAWLSVAVKAMRVANVSLRMVVVPLFVENFICHSHVRDSSLWLGMTIATFVTLRHEASLVTTAWRFFTPFRMTMSEFGMTIMDSE